jgi:simple sugar transport system ATP-binding protein
MKAESGEISILGNDVANKSPRYITELGTAHIPEDRQKDGLILPSRVHDNLVLNTYYLEPFAKGIVLQPEVIEKNASELVEAFDIRTPGITAITSGLSGGNQQKVIVAREFSRKIKLLIASQPTRGLDVGSIEYIHGRMIEKRDEGTAILLVSTELDEVMQLSDRIAVMFRGEIIAIVDADIATKEEIGLLMAGIKTEISGKKRKPKKVREIVT